MLMTNQANSEQRVHEAIAKRAYELYEANGRQDGHDLEHWRQAESELYPEGAPPAAPPDSNEDAPSARPS